MRSSRIISVFVFFFSFSLSLASFAGQCCTMAEEEWGWRNLFDGKTLRGWVQRGGKAKYVVEDGAIVGISVPGTPNSFLCTEDTFGDFVLELDFKVDKGLNSGIQIRSNSYPWYRNGRVHGYQVEIDPSPRAWTGGIYDEARRGWLYPLKNNPKARAAFKQGKWNHFRIEAIGDHIVTYLNGVKAADLRDSLTSRGFIALQVHSSRKAGLKVCWKNIRIKVLDHPIEIRVLIIDGENNHNWRATTPVLKEILEDAGIFRVEVATTPKDISKFRVDFSKYDVVLSNYNGRMWPEETARAFVKFIKEGGGLVVVHAADNSFPNWKEYNEMIGLGGWGGRNEKWGPLVYWEKGKIVRDYRPGRAGSHGRQWPYLVEIRNSLHPITWGLPKKWRHVADELYSELRGPAKNLGLLATAWADPKTGGTGRHEPVLFTVRYGKGRIFHTTMGHGPEQMRCGGFAFTLQRGTEWAATGRVTLTSVPAYFPPQDKPSLWIPKKYFEAIKTWDFGKSRKELAYLEEAARGAHGRLLRWLEDGLLEVLEDPKTTFAGKQFVMRFLRRIGSVRCVHPLSKYLNDDKLSHMARFALQHLPYAEATQALVKALPKAKDRLKVGIIGSLGERGDPSVVPEIAPYVSSSNADLCAAALRALGRIGSEKAMEVLRRSRVPASLEELRNESTIACAEKLIEKGERQKALKVLSQIAESPLRSPTIRLAAYGAIFKAKRAEAVPLLLKLMKGRRRIFRNGAKRFLLTLPGKDITEAIGKELLKAPESLKPVLIDILRSRKDKAGASALLETLESSSKPEIQLSCVKALGEIGTSSAVKPLLKLLSREDELGREALFALASLRAEGVDEVLLRAVENEKGSKKVKLLEVAVAREGRKALDLVLKTARDPDPQVRYASFQAISSLVTLGDFEKLIQLYLENKKDRNEILKAILKAVGRIENKEKLSDSLSKAFAEVDLEGKKKLLKVFPLLSTKKLFEAAKEACLSEDLNFSLPATRALSEWQNTEPLSFLKELALHGKSQKIRREAFRGYIRLLSQPANRPSRKTVKLFEEALRVAESSQDKKSLLEGLSHFPCKEAEEVLKRYLQDPELRQTATRSLASVREALARARLSATASHNAGQANLAFDNRPETRWSTNTPMRPGMWYMLDLGRECAVKKIILDTRRSPGDYPRGSEIYVSFDGKTWGSPVLVKGPQGPITVYEFKKPVYARYIKIVQKGKTQGLYWSIHELKVETE